MVKNRIQALLARHHVPLPAVSDIFGKRGLDYLTTLKLEDGAQELLRQDLEVLKALTEDLKADIEPKACHELVGKSRTVWPNLPISRCQ